MEVLHPPHILVLEDDPDLLEMLTDLLEERGYRVTPVSRGEDAVEKARQENLDLFVADVRMRGLDGLEALEQAKNFQQDVGSLVISGYTSEAETLRALNLEVGGFLKKPFPLDEFLRRVEELLAEKERVRRWSEGQASLGRGLLWSIERLAETDEELARIAERARGLADHLGYPPAQARELGAAACLLAGRKKGLFEPPEPFLQGDAGHRLLTRILSFPWEEPVEEAPSLPVQLVSLALGREPSYPLAQELSQAEAALRRGSPGPGASHRSQDGLLSVAQALERAGQLEESVAAYQQLAGTPGVSPERVEARLGLARLALRTGDRARALTLAHPLADEAATFGEAFQGRVLLRLGLLLEEPRALTRAGELLARSGQLFEEAKCRLALAGLVGETELEKPLSVLADPRFTPRLGDALGWLLPVLLSLGNESAAELGSRLLVRFPRRAVGRLATLPVDQRQRSLDWLAGTTRSLPTALIEALSEDPDPTVRSRALALGRGSARENQPMLTLVSLGPFQVTVGEEVLENRQWATAKTRHLFALLASHGDRPLQVDSILEEFWPHHFERGRRSLWQATSSIRRLLRQSGLPEAVDPVIRDGETLQFNPEVPRWHDLEEFEKALVGEELQAAVGFYSGPFLEGCYMDWALRRRQQLEDKFCQALQELAQGCLESSPGEAAEYSRRLLEFRPHRQDIVQLRMTALLALGRPQEAISDYDRLHRLLRAEYESEPTIELMKLYHRAQIGLSPEVCS